MARHFMIVLATLGSAASAAQSVCRTHVYTGSNACNGLVTIASEGYSDQCWDNKCGIFDNGTFATSAVTAISEKPMFPSNAQLAPIYYVRKQYSDSSCNTSTLTNVRAFVGNGTCFPSGSNFLSTSCNATHATYAQCK
jgi:hypothetical protein